MKSKFLLIYSWFVRSTLFFLPDIPLVSRFRGWLYGLGMRRCGKNLIVQHDAILRDLQNLEFGSNIRIANHAFIMGSGRVEIGDCAIIGPHSLIVAGNHTLGNGSYRNGKCMPGVIRIKAGAWVGGNCTVAAGAVLPEMSVLGANSMLNKPFDTPKGIYAGVPAKLIKTIG